MYIFMLQDRSRLQEPLSVDHNNVSIEVIMFLAKIAVKTTRTKTDFRTGYATRNT